MDNFEQNISTASLRMLIAISRYFKRTNPDWLTADDVSHRCSEHKHLCLITRPFSNYPLFEECLISQTWYICHPLFQRCNLKLVLSWVSVSIACTESTVRCLAGPRGQASPKKPCRRFRSWTLFQFILPPFLVSLYFFLIFLLIIYCYRLLSLLIPLFFSTKCGRSTSSRNHPVFPSNRGWKSGQNEGSTILIHFSIKTEQLLTIIKVN